MSEEQQLSLWSLALVDVFLFQPPHQTCILQYRETITPYHTIPYTNGFDLYRASPYLIRVGVRVGVKVRDEVKVRVRIKVKIRIRIHT